MNFNISKRDKGLLLILAGLAVFLILYLLVFNSFQAKGDEAAQQIQVLKPQLQTLEQEYNDLDTYKSGIADFRSSVSKKMAAFPTSIKEEDMMSYLLTLETNQKINIDDVSFSGTTPLMQFQGIVDQNGQDTPVTLDAGSVGAVFNGQLTYPQLKSVLNYLYSTKTQSSVNSVTVSFNSETGGLTGSFDISRYYLTWPDAAYTPEPLPDSPIGVKDLFGTSAPAAENQD